ncbi:glycoside hydrolase family 36 protein [Kitasatospora purpeofusca]|uniref:glycoside hydrolase family 36 protein n=1 Tax=Kitasatospora purpeofusca TaxID=67352 RepID=UPI0035D70516
MLQESVADQVTLWSERPYGIRLAVTESAAVVGIRDEGPVRVVEFEAGADGPLLVTLQVPLADAVGFWNANSRYHRTVLPDWMCKDVTSLVNSAPVGCLYDNAGSSLLAFGLGELVEEVKMRFGVSEEEKAFVVHLTLLRATAGQRVRLALAAPGGDYTGAIDAVHTWFGALVEVPSMPVPRFATEPVYSTWYSFGQDVDAAGLEEEGAHAAALGLKSLFVDDGWQRYGYGRGYAGCGDWVPDEDKFPDFRAHVERLHALGLKVVLWVAPLLLGPKADCFEELAHLAPEFKGVLATNIVDPRLPEARRFLVEACVRLVRDYGVDGLKIDFLDEAMVYKAAPSTGDIADVGVAMQAWMGDLVTALAELGRPDALIEFRQPYVSPSIAPYGNVLRANDCPADAISNRASIVDARLLAAGRVVHSDMMMWDPSGEPHVASRQLLNAFFSVPQISVRLATLPEPHRRALEFVLAQWESVKSVALRSELRAGLPVENYPWISARSDEGVRVVGVYGAGSVPVGPDDTELLLLNGTAQDHLVLDFGRPSTGIGTLDIEVFEPDGTRVRDGAGIRPDGLFRLPVPRCGIARVRRS